MSVTANISVSLDGYFTGPDPSPQDMMGVDGEAIHSWFAHDVADRAQLTADEVLRPEFERTGAMVMGRDSYEHAQAAWGPHPPFEMPIFVLTHRPRQDDVRDGSTFHFVTEGFEAALERATTAASDKDVGLHGGRTIQQGLRHGVLDELQLHLVPILLGRGRRLFDNLGDRSITLDPIRVAEGTGVTHLKYHVRGT